ncbi:50S ribosomal protein L11 methyltransferase [Brevibacillus sp. TJ4]|uniref:50S ribosomal protein L11 methyltransferase n=1 Tax=Brevibacillus sp. TJ4 TaxID=3234853 RepID=UPI0037CE08E8
MNWSEISIHTTAEATEAVSSLLYELGANGVVIEDPEVLHRQWDTPFGEIYQLSPDDFPDEGVFVKAYLPADSSELIDVVEELKEQLAELTTFGLDIGKATIAVNDVREDEWAHAWKKYYKPIHVTDRMTIKPVWEAYELRSEDEIIIEMDPGMAFGTGTHPTTILCLQSLEKYLQPGDRVYDVGTGTAILSIAAVKLGASHVLAMDLDEVAVRSAQANTELNGVAEQITVRQNNLLDGIEEQVEVVVANILAEVILRFTDDVFRVLKPGGVFIASGIIEARAEDVKQAIVASGMEIVEMISIDDWVAIVSKKR